MAAHWVATALAIAVTAAWQAAVGTVPGTRAAAEDPPERRAHPSARDRLYLPHAAQRGTDALERCASTAACPGARGWVVQCGGMGRVRDLLAVRPLGTSEVGSVVAVGDGVAVFKPQSSGWTVQLGHDLSGLNGLYVPSTGSGWAVGERGRVARYDVADACWVAAEPEAQLNGSVSLSAVMTVEEGGEGWAVGRRSLGGQLLWMQRAAGSSRWLDASGWIPGLAPLSDVHLVRPDPGGGELSWLVSPDAGGVYEGRLGGDATVVIDGFVPAAGPAGEEAKPREVAMRSGPPDEGWLLGASDASGRQGVTGWRHTAGSGWLAEWSLPERDLVDLYFDGAEGAGRWWLGVSPTERRSPVLYTTDRADGQGTWEPLDRRGPPLPAVAVPADREGNAAIASLGDEGLLYAWGGEVWRFDRQTEDWVRQARRHRIIDIAPMPVAGRAWLLAGAQPGREDLPPLLELSPGGVRPSTVAMGAAGSLDLRALEDGWAVGARGVTLRTSRAGWVEESSAGPDVDLVGLAVAGAPGQQRVWAVGHDAVGDGLVLLRDADVGGWRRLARVPGRRLLAVAALADEAWAVGDGTACDCDPRACRCETVLPFAGAGSPSGRRLHLRSVVAVPSQGGAAVFAGGDYYVVRRAPGGWAVTRRAVRLAGVPEGATITDLAAGAEDDLWALATCTPYPQAGRGVSIVTRFDGALTDPGEIAPTHEAMAIGVPLQALRVAPGTAVRTAWLAGDWTTVLRFAYPAGPAPAPLPPPEPDLRCLPVHPFGP